MSDIYTCLIDTPLGKMRAARNEDAITGLWFEGQKYYPNKDKWIETKEHYLFKSLNIWIDKYFDGAKEICDLPLFLAGTPFQKKVWEILRQIEYGQSVTYGEIAKELSLGLSKMSAQAVGGAVGHNPISILIPCHRVLGSNGMLIGYAGGVDKKRFLLELEGVNFNY
ncbi:MAG: methylated-DNA--[protein]-cysteine S-methyltransferase [Campylobacteraceae bacterium]|jgi:methylated-DNA-[protein]-cysteine S-methyltransferase|nr:methylated-DNA--[protein]-cysteine S-methyltransferase [Campylobacteraceae bacterium]